jgi:hypothetical protein
MGYAGFRALGVRYHCGLGPAFVMYVGGAKAGVRLLDDSGHLM